MPYTIDEVTAKVGENMPSLSPTAAKVMKLANDINTPPADLTKVIKLDPVLSAKVMKLVNSSYFGFSEKIVSLEKAVIMLGLNTIKNLALSAAVLTQMEAKQQNNAFDGDAFWKHSLAVGVCGKLIAREREVPKKELEDYFIAGLLHDLGLFAEAAIYPEEMKRVTTTSTEVGLLESEDIVLDGLNHCSVGEILGKQWYLSEGLVSVIRNHHSPLDVSQPSALCMTAHLANNICKNNAVGLVLDHTPVETDPTVYERLGVQPGIEKRILEVIETEIGKAMEFLKA